MNNLYPVFEWQPDNHSQKVKNLYPGGILISRSGF
jgi:hypothetical protein